MGRGKKPRIFESGGPQAPKPRDRGPRCLGVGRAILGRVPEGPRPLSVKEDPFSFSASCAFGADLDNLGIVCDVAGMAACGLWRLE